MALITAPMLAIAAPIITAAIRWLDKREDRKQVAEVFRRAGWLSDAQAEALGDEAEADGREAYEDWANRKQTP